MKKAGPVAATAVATFFGIGRIPFAPGTAASLLTVIILSPLRNHAVPIWAILALVAGAGTWASGACEKAWKQKDPSAIVIDEVLGMGLALALSPGSGWQGAFTGFILFRLFDILKPWPISRLERLPGGIGIMADDAGAGIATALVMWAIMHISRTLPALQILIYY